LATYADAGAKNAAASYYDKFVAGIERGEPEDGTAPSCAGRTEKAATGAAQRCVTSTKSASCSSGRAASLAGAWPRACLGNLDSLGQQLANLQAAGNQMECSNEIYSEAQWLRHYTAD
jgi:hypothetical protein